MLLVDEGTLGGNKSVSWFKGRYGKLLHKFTSGFGSFSQWTLIPHWGYLKKANIRMSGYISTSRRHIP